MAGVAGNAFKATCLEAGLNKAAQAEDQYLILFKNNYTPLEDDVLADYTEATFTGYAQVALTGAGWTVAPGAPAVATQTEKTFASTADQTAQLIYGYAIFLDTSDEFVGGERFPTPQTVQNNGDEIKITPRLRLYTKA